MFIKAVLKKLCTSYEHINSLKVLAVYNNGDKVVVIHRLTHNMLTTNICSLDRVLFSYYFQGVDCILWMPLIP